MKRFLLALVALLPMAARADRAAPIGNPIDYEYNQHPGASLPLDAQFVDAAGHPLRLGDLARDKPLIIDLGYFHCPSLCGVVRSDLMNALSLSGLVGGRDYTLVDVSIDPGETTRDAAAAKAEDLARFPQPDNGRGWHYLTGAQPAITALAGSVGFPLSFDAALRQFVHPAGVVVASPQGIVSGYLLGVGYSAGDLRAAVLRAGKGGIAAAALPVLLLCFHFDATTGRYTLAITKVLRLAGVLTVLTIGALLLLLHRRDRTTRMRRT